MCGMYSRALRQCKRAMMHVKARGDEELGFLPKEDDPAVGRAPTRMQRREAEDS